MSVDFNYLLKYIIIGNSGVGKSNILLRYVHNQFNDEFKTTVGVEFGAKNIEINKKRFRIQIWDTAGQENFRSITRAYYKNSVCACIVYDITNRTSFEEIQSWLNDCKKQTPKTIELVLVGNKNDLEKDRKVTFEEGKAYAEKNNMIFLETSAKTGDNIKKIFEMSTKKIDGNISNGVYDLSNDACGIREGIKCDTFKIDENLVYEDKKNNKKKCC